MHPSQEGSISPAWDPSSTLEDDSGESTQPTAQIVPGKHRSLLIYPDLLKKLSFYLGQWLLDGRLVDKKLDVRIQGTKTTLFHNGRYEDNCGFIVMKRLLASVDESVVVKLGFEHTQRSFPLRYLVPERTTERPGFVEAKFAKSIAQEPGERVVIIGPDLTGSLDAVGSLGTIFYSYFVLPPDQALVMIRSNGEADRYLYYSENSLCRSHLEKEVFY